MPSHEGREAHHNMKVIEQYAAAFQAAPGPTLLVEEGGTIAFANTALNQLFGYGDKELVGQPVEALVPNGKRQRHPALREAYERLPASRQMGSGRDLYGLRKTGELVPVEIGLNRILSDAGNFVVASIVDLTQRKNDEGRMRLAIDAAGNAMIMTNAQGEIVLANNRAYEMFGYAPDELLKKPVEALVPTAIKRVHSVYRASYAVKRISRPMGQDEELLARHKDGSEFPVEISLTPIDSEDDALTMATVQDVSAARAAAQEIEGQNANLIRLNSELAQFMYSTSHELKAPLATVEGLLTCIEDDALAQNHASVVQHANMALGLTRKLKVLMENAQGIVKSELLDEDWASVPVLEAVNQALAMQAPESARSSDSDIQISVAVEPNLSVRTQPTRFKQILENLVSNSLKFKNPKQPTPQLSIAAKRDNGQLCLKIEDNGIGIPSNEREHVFALFKRCTNHSKLGSGLGLALVKQHVESLHGHIAFTSSERGTNFSIEIPDALEE